MCADGSGGLFACNRTAMAATASEICFWAALFFISRRPFAPTASAAASRRQHWRRGGRRAGAAQRNGRHATIVCVPAVPLGAPAGELTVMSLRCCGSPSLRHLLTPRSSYHRTHGPPSSHGCQAQTRPSPALRTSGPQRHRQCPRARRSPSPTLGGRDSSEPVAPPPAAGISMLAEDLSSDDDDGEEPEAGSSSRELCAHLSAPLADAAATLAPDGRLSQLAWTAAAHAEPSAEAKLNTGNLCAPSSAPLAYAAATLAPDGHVSRLASTAATHAEPSAEANLNTENLCAPSSAPLAYAAATRVSEGRMMGGLASGRAATHAEPSAPANSSSENICAPSSAPFAYAAASKGRLSQLASMAATHAEPSGASDDYEEERPLACRRDSLCRRHARPAAVEMPPPPPFKLPRLPAETPRVLVRGSSVPPADSRPRKRTVFETFAFEAAVAPAHGAQGSVASDAPLRVPPPPLTQPVHVST
jgi:hypothetical protein